MSNKSIGKRVVKNLLFVVSVLLFASIGSGCKNVDTYLNSKYFLDNSSDLINVQSLVATDNNTTELAKMVNPAIVAISSVGNNYTSIGSGVCVKSGGYILTNQHVIAGAKTITLYMHDNKTASAITLWQDEIMDIAILKSSVAIPYLPMGDNDKTIVGEDVVAVGTPLSLNFTHTYTKGIVSAKNRTIQINTDNGEALMQNLIQHDASINPGNSGGPLINNLGFVIGINTLKINTAEGLGFAIPINSVVSVVENVYNNFNYKTPFLGVYGYDVALNNYYNDGSIDSIGFYVETVAENSPAYSAGVREGDVIILLNNALISNALDFRKELYKNNVNDIIKIKIIRDNQLLDKIIALQETKEDFVKDSLLS